MPHCDFAHTHAASRTADSLRRKVLLRNPGKENSTGINCCVSVVLTVVRL